MELQFLGCGSAFNPLLGNTSSYIEIGRHLYLIDAGESVFYKLFKEEILKRNEEITIFITHMHGDHIGSLASIISYCYFVLRKKVSVVYPKDDLWKLLNLMGIASSIYDRLECYAFKNDEIKMRAISVKHADDISYYGYIMEWEGKKIYYSGDSYEIPQDIYKDFMAGNIDRIYQDTTEFKTSHLSHLPLEELEKCIPVNLRNKVFCIHFTTDFANKLKEKGFQYVKV